MSRASAPTAPALHFVRLRPYDAEAATFPRYSNQLCSDVPTQVQALSSNVDAGGNSIVWKVTDGNSIGTTCGWIYDARFPGAGPTNATSIEHGSEVRHGVWVVVGRDEYVIGDVWVAGKD